MTRPGRIRILAPEVVTQIAAGEVVERPASVVKELLENAIDAGASRLDVAVVQGGLELIRVADDGCGIEAEDLPLAFACHATSKLSSATDLARIATLGFRGEALASIAAVAQVTLQSRPHHCPVGAEIRCQAGQLSPVRPWNGSPGTRVEVRQLFCNTPVRRRFLRSVATEMGHIAEAVIRLALARPHLQLRLTHNDRLVHEVPASASFLDRLGLFFGPDLSDRLLEVAAQAGPLRLHGYIADPAYDRGHSRMQYFFVNGRWVRDRLLTHALQDAYQGLLMTGRQPVAFLTLELPPEEVDVNVHPTKCEVRFRDSQGVFHLVRGAVRERLRQADLLVPLRLPAARLVPAVPQAPVAPAGSPSAARVPAGTADAAAPQEASPPHAVPSDAVVPDALSSPVASVPAPAAGDEAASPSLAAVRPPRALQMHNAYLVLETPDGMLVIDQHALHERVLYEAWKSRLRQGQLETQPLLVPEPVELTPQQAACALEHRPLLARLGLSVEEFGGNTVLVRSYPALASRTSPAVLLRTAVEQLLRRGPDVGPELLLDDLLRQMACKAAIKAGDPLSEAEVEALVRQRHLADDTHHCPHGRPAALLLRRDELDRQFRRH